VKHTFLLHKCLSCTNLSVVKMYKCTSWKHMEEWRCNSTHSQPWHKIEVTEQLPYYGHLIPRYRHLVIPWRGGWVGPEDSLGAWSAEKSFVPTRDIKIPHHCHISNSWLENNISFVICSYIYNLSTIFHMHSSKGSLVIAITPEGN